MYVLSPQPLLTECDRHRFCFSEDDKTDEAMTGLPKRHRQRRVLRPRQDAGMELKHHRKLSWPAPPMASRPATTLFTDDSPGPSV